ncbi:hypothetical protein [Fictibacillus phosphorivorans]|uniref:hypothetical protein n=1 Tax=Fictibacillus phosphorivorans TaxID=1221500 RepID=UPI001293044B|nr:hypothetical protein [Fictibacillus phosphorivorans]MQR97246.1 hypothetical protein [Fictibacillus phosphorivorans]
MKSITIQLEYDERTFQESQDLEKMLEEKLSGTDLKLVSVSPTSGRKAIDIMNDKDSTGAGGQTSPDNEKPPNRN